MTRSVALAVLILGAFSSSSPAKAQFQGNVQFGTGFVFATEPKELDVELFGYGLDVLLELGAGSFTVQTGARVINAGMFSRIGSEGSEFDMVYAAVPLEFKIRTPGLVGVYGLAGGEVRFLGDAIMENEKITLNDGTILRNRTTVLSAGVGFFAMTPKTGLIRMRKRLDIEAKYMFDMNSFEVNSIDGSGIGANGVYLRVAVGGVFSK